MPQCVRAALPLVWCPKVPFPVRRTAINESGDQRDGEAERGGLTHGQAGRRADLVELAPMLKRKQASMLMTC